MKKFFFFFAVLVIPSLLLGQDVEGIQLANEYLIQGEEIKALDIYQNLAKSPANIPLIHANYFTLLIQTQDYKSATKYIQRLIKDYPDNINYQIDLGILYQDQNLLKESDLQFKQVIESTKSDQYLLRLAAQYFTSKQLFNYAVDTYNASRKVLKQPNAYNLELANLYRVLGQKSEMLNEYMSFASTHPNNLNYVKNILQSLLTEEDDLRELEQTLIQKAQENPNDIIYSDLIIWVNLQRKDFYGAFLQTKALEKRIQSDGVRLLEIGMIALENKAYDDATKIFTYITTEYPKSPNYPISRKLMINAREGLVKNTFPINYDEIKRLILDYQNLVDELGLNPSTLEALRNKALLHAFYLDEKEIAIQILQQIISIPRASAELQANCKIDLGDIYILIGQPWESALLYSQVEKANKETPTGYMAKLKNARLNYYKGDFELAKGHLDILKLATSREISNDAIALGVLIEDNTALDTSDYVMREYAAVELLLFQNKLQESIIAFESMLKKYPRHSLTDEIYWNLANIYQKLGKFDLAVNYLAKISEDYNEDILADDAYYLMARIYEDQLGDREKAKALYREFLVKYPGSKFVAEARLHFRKLRGDIIN
jgi:tetratricopeptide (TPR) repeat protein